MPVSTDGTPSRNGQVCNFPAVQVALKSFAKRILFGPPIVHKRIAYHHNIRNAVTRAVSESVSIARPLDDAEGASSRYRAYACLQLDDLGTQATACRESPFWDPESCIWTLRSTKSCQDGEAG